MTVDADIVAALKESLRDLGEAREDCLGAGAIAALSRVARPGLRVRIDLEASREIGAPLVTMSRDAGVELFEMLTPRQVEVADNGRGKLAGSKVGLPADPRPASPGDANVSGGVAPRALILPKPILIGLLSWSSATPNSMNSLVCSQSGWPNSQKAPPIV